MLLKGIRRRRLNTGRHEPGGEIEVLDSAWQSSPVSSVEHWRSPVLLIHGDDDRNVHVLQTLDLVRRLSETSVRYETMILPDEQHGLARYSSVAAVDSAEVAFLEQHLVK
jgi:dipeptidyl aminopeptidase/acylaminoacyl peptidase